MKKIIFGVLLGFLFVFAGCNDDEGYSLNDMWIGFGILQGDETDTYQIAMDNGDLLIPIASNYPPYWYDRFENGDRVRLNYTILGDNLDDNGEIESYYVKINSVKDILMKGVMDITPENEDSIGNDAIIVEDYWMTDSLLNFKLKYWGYDRVHFLNLVKQPGDILEEDQPIELELRHNANDDEESIPYTAYVSFSLNSLRIDGLDSVRFVVTATDYDGNGFSEEYVFDYSELPEVL